MTQPDATRPAILERGVSDDAVPPTSTALKGARLSNSGHIKTRIITKPYAILLSVILILLVLTVIAFMRMDYGNVNIIMAFIRACEDFGTMVLTPRLDGHFTAGDLVSGLFITLALATLTTLTGALVAFVLSLLAAVNLSNRPLSIIIKLLMSMARAVPTILWVLVFTVAIGLGSEAAVIGMMFHSVAYLVKAYSESFEELDRGVLEALRSTGATWWQIVARGLIPEKLNEILSWTFIRFEVNFVAAVVVAGMAGSGGIGYSLFLAGNFYFDIHEIGLIVYLCFAISVGLEVVATRLRKRAAIKH